MERLEPQALDAAADALLANGSAACLLALGPNGLRVPVPDSLPLTTQRVITSVTSCLDLVVQTDISAVLDVWDDALRGGSSLGTVHPVDDPDHAVQLFCVDQSHRYGVYLAVILGLRQVSLDRVGVPEESPTPRVGVMRKNHLAVVTGADQATQRILGWSEEELLGRRALDLTHPDDQSRAIANWMDLLVNPGVSQRVRLRYRSSDGSWIWFEVTNRNLLDDPDHGYVLAEWVDISQEMAAVEAVRASEELLRRLLQALPVGVLQVGASGVVAVANDHLKIMVGHPVSEVEHLVSCLDQPETFGTALDAALQNGVDSDLELRLTGDRGDARHVQIKVRCLWGDGESGGAVVCLSDVSEAVLLREELARRAPSGTAPARVAG